MTSLLNRLAIVILAATVANILVFAQNYQQYDDQIEERIEDVLKLLNMKAQMTNKPTLDSSEDYAFEDIQEDGRESRSFGISEHLCMVVRRGHEELSNSNFEYRPSVLEEKDCVPVTENIDTGRRELCYVHGSGCQTVTREMALFKRIRRAGHCWKPEIRNVSIGCQCHFDKKNLQGKSFI